MTIEVNPQKCIGCFCCTLACSFHHGRNFSPENSSIIIRLDGESAIHSEVLPSCDRCAGEMKPLCLEFCPVGAVSIQEKQSSL